MSEDNSTALPAPAHPYVPQAGLFYRVDSSRSTFAELWRDTRSPVVLIAWLSKLLRLKLPGSVNDPNVVSLQPFVVSAGDESHAIPPTVMTEFAPVLRELTELRFGEPVYFMIDDRFHSSRTIQVALLHRDGQAIARVTHRAEGIQGKKAHFFAEFLTELPGDSFLHSSSAKAQLNAAPGCRLNWRPRATTSQLWVSHRQELEATGQSAAAVRPSSRTEMVDLLERHHEAVRDFQLQRGVFSSMSGEDLAQVRALDRNIELARSGQSREPDVMAYLERLQQKRATPSNTLIVLIISIGLFIGLGASTWEQPWLAVLMIAGVLFVHEAGHYLAMLIFKYRNVRMFFIPLFGAAVSGHNYAAPGWKRVVVALMGPLPGIGIGVVLGIVGMIRGDETLGTIAIMFIVLNGLQLIPLMPLDGGRVAHALLFSRHYSLDAVFQGVAGVALASIGFMFNSMLTAGLGIVMFVGLPATFKVARIARELRQQGLGRGSTSTAPASASATFSIPQSARTSAEWPGSSRPSGPAPDPDSQTELMPRPIAEIIITKIRSRFHQVKHPRQIAQLALRVYEVLLTRPPGILASLGFGLVHVTSLVVAFIMIGAIVITRNPNWQQLVQANEINPTRIVDTRTIQEWAAQPSVTEPVALDGHAESAPNPHKTLVATFATAVQAGQAFDEVRQDAPAGAHAAQFGQSLLLTLPSSDLPTKWFDTFEGRAEGLFVDDGQGSEAYFILTCHAADRTRAAAIVDRLTHFLETGTWLQLIPPWVVGALDTRSEEERARHDRARAVFHRLNGLNVYDAPELATMRGDLARASRRGDRAEYDRLSTQLIEAQNELRLKKLEQLRKDISPEHYDLLDRYIAITIEKQQVDRLTESDDDDGYAARYAALDALNARENAELGPLLGQWTMVPDGKSASPDAVRYQRRFGHAMLALSGKLAITIEFDDAAHGAPALVRWLDQQGCTQFRYEFRDRYAELE